MTKAQLKRTSIGAAAAAALLAGAGVVGPPATASAQRALSAGQTDASYIATLSPVNSNLTMRSATGEVRFTIRGDSLRITVNASGLPKEIEHWQHIHGFPDGQQASCPSASADLNHDGIIDVVETGKMAGTTMVPFTGDPVSMDVPHGVYPHAAASGTLQYTETVSLSALQAAFGKAFPGQKLDLAHRVVFIHGVPAGTTLPASVASLGPIPAHVTLPIACGRISAAR